MRADRDAMRIVWVSIAIVLFDQVTKLLIKGFSIPALGINVDGLALGSSRPILGDLVRLTYIENPGMAFGIDLGGKLFFSIFTVIASVGIAMYLYRMRGEAFPLRFSLAMILGGACGNLIDRVFYGLIYDGAPLFYGKVVDFIDVDFFNISLLGYHLSRWPVFNVADASVSVGVVLLLFVHRGAKQPQATPAAPAPMVDAVGPLRERSEASDPPSVLPEQERPSSPVS